MKIIMKKIHIMCEFIGKVNYKFIKAPLMRSRFNKCGRNVHIGKGGNFTFDNIEIGDDTSIGDNAMFMCTRARITIGRKVMFGPHVSMITGGHRIDVVGRYMKDIGNEEKLPENDRNIVICDDVWIGANVTILKGVTIGEGSVIAAGSVVTKDIEPYSIAGGVPARKIKMRFSSDEIKKHKEILI